MSFRTNKLVYAGRLTKLRTDLGMSREQLADEADITINKVQKLEDPEHRERAGRDAIGRLAKALNTTVNYIQFGIPALPPGMRELPYMPRSFVPQTLMEASLHREVVQLERLLVWATNEAYSEDFEEQVDNLFNGQPIDARDCDCGETDPDEDDCDSCAVAPDTDNIQFERWFVAYALRARTESKNMTQHGQKILDGLTEQDRAALELLGVKFPSK